MKGCITPLTDIPNRHSIVSWFEALECVRKLKLDLVERGRPDASFHGNANFKKFSPETKSFSTGSGSKSKTCTKFSGFKSVTNPKLNLLQFNICTKFSMLQKKINLCMQNF